MPKTETAAQRPNWGKDLSWLPYVTLLLCVRGNTETERWALDRRRSFDAVVASMVQAAVDDGEISGEEGPWGTT